MENIQQRLRANLVGSPIPQYIPCAAVVLAMAAVWSIPMVAATKSKGQWGRLWG